MEISRLARQALVPSAYSSDVGSNIGQLSWPKLCSNASDGICHLRAEWWNDRIQSTESFRINRKLRRSVAAQRFMMGAGAGAELPCAATLP